MSHIRNAIVVLLVLAASGQARDCVAECDRALAACLARAASAVRECQAAVRQDCGAACACDGTEGAARIACLQRCEVCEEMERQLAGRDCGALDDERRDECDDELEDCKAGCGE